MPTKMKASVATLMVVFAVSCGDQSVTAPTNRLTPSASAAASRTDQVAKQEVTGAAVYFVTSENNQAEGYALSAIRHTDGRVTGELELSSAINGGYRIHGEIACFTIVGNSARLAARVTQSTNSNVSPGAYLFWSLTDNGEGRKAAPDQTSHFFLSDQTLAQIHCTSGAIIPAMYDVRAGNLQVH